MNYEQYLEEFGELTYRFRGTSMLPLLKEIRDLFTVRNKTPGERFKGGDFATIYLAPFN